MSEDNKLVTIDPTASMVVASDSFEVDFSTIEKITPFTLSIDQPNTQHEGSTPGMLRIAETGQLRKTVKVVLIEKPKPMQRYQLGEFPNQTLVCKSRDGITPDKDAPSPQAMACIGCKHNEASGSKGWDRYRENPDKKNIPGCKITARVVMIDYERTAPIKMYVKGVSRREGLEQGLQQIVQQFIALKNANGKVSWTDVAMTLTTEKIKNNANYKLIIREVHPLTEEEKKHLSSILDIIGRQKADLMAKIEAKAEFDQAEAVGEEQTAQVAKATEVTKPSSNVIEGEYVQPTGSIKEV